MSIHLVLASASPARLATLRSAGIDPAVVVSEVDEDALLRQAATDGHPTPTEQVQLLARAKARDVAGRLSVVPGVSTDTPGALPDGAGRTADLVLGCDSMLELDGEIYGKPRDAAHAVSRWRAMRGRSGVLHTGHWLVDVRPDAAGGGASRAGAAVEGSVGEARGGSNVSREAGASSATVVHFADLSDAEIRAYVDTGEPLAVAGAFTIDGLGGPFVERIDGDHHGVVGLSLPLLRTLLGELGVSLVDLWSPR